MASATVRKLQYSETGDPRKVLTVVEDALEHAQLKDQEVLVRWKAAPINPADVNQVQGVYGIKSTLPAVGGNEGAGVVEQVGPSVSSLKTGDHVLAFLQGGQGEVEVGTWRTRHLVTEHQLRRVPNELPIEDAAILKVNPPTAYRMLSDFAKLDDKSLVVQNGATSGVGRAVIQLARLKFGAKTLNIFRDRKDDAKNKQTADELMSIGADAAITDTYFGKHAREIAEKYGRAQLGLNCVGGPITARMCQMLDDGAPLVSYGGMSMQPVQAPTGPLIFNELSLRGFWLSKWYSKRENDAEADRMLDELAQMVIDGKFKMNPYEVCKLDDYRAAFDKTMHVQGAPKQILLLE